MGHGFHMPGEKPILGGVLLAMLADENAGVKRYHHFPGKS